MIAAMYERKAGLPKREPVSIGGLACNSSSAESRMESIFWQVGVMLSEEMAEMGVLRTESEMPKTKARMSEYVEEERKRSWSCGERMRRIGMLNCMLTSAGGSGSGGVGGAGSEGADADVLRWRGSNRGSFC